MFKFCLFFNPIVSTVLLYEMFYNSGETNFFSYVVLGSGLMSLWGCICFSSAGDINRERHGGTLAIIYAAPVKFNEIIMGKILGNTFLSLLSFFICLFISVVLFHIPIIIGNPLLFIISFLATIISFVVIATIVAYLLMLSRKTELYMNCIEVPLIVLSGFVFPVSILPMPIQIISKILPSTYAVELMRSSVYGVESKDMFWKEFALLLFISFIYSVLSKKLYRIIDKKVRIEGNLDVV